jgi:predicted Zn-ribbon and HTH transcriptional regulator
MDALTEKRKGVHDLQELLDAVPADRTVACLPTHESLILHDGNKEFGRIPLDGIADVSLLVDSSVHRNYTLIRSLILGPLVLLFPKKTVRETYRLCIQWKDRDGDYHFTYIRSARRIMADHMLNTIKHSLIPAVRAELQAHQRQDRAAVPENEQQQRLIEPSPFITCGSCGMEYRESDLPPGGKCPVCGRQLPFNAYLGINRTV